MPRTHVTRSALTTRRGNVHGRSHVSTRGGTPVIAPTVPDTPDVDPPPVCGESFQAMVDAATAGTTLDITGCVYNAGATVNKALTIVGGTINVPAGNNQAVLVTANDVKIRNMTMTGPDALSYTELNQGVRVNASSGARITGLEVSGCTISDFRGFGMYLRYVQGATISNNTVRDITYTGIMLLSDLDSTIDGNTVQRIGISNSYTGDNNNAYGIVTTTLQTGDVRSDGTIISDNIIGGPGIVGVPTWHGLDTHGGNDHQWLRNTVYGCNRGLFLTSDDDGNDADNHVVTDNWFGEPKHGGAFPTYPHNMRGITVVSGATNITGSGNTIDGHPTGETISGTHSITGTTATNARASGYAFE